ncbi:unnamed protein product [Pleuronectes platessa]|uniref:Uncharacterized protein n=1 Tax=Pleuronectes platessa TaxID=8262 RepID=A0A9N7W161_PLEPL|nr:unnamed protein product [Pleuronectes platessa]
MSLCGNEKPHKSSSVHLKLTVQLERLSADFILGGEAEKGSRNFAFAHTPPLGNSRGTPEDLQKISRGTPEELIRMILLTNQPMRSENTFSLSEARTTEIPEKEPLSPSCPDES